MMSSSFPQSQEWYQRPPHHHFEGIYHSFCLRRAHQRTALIPVRREQVRGIFKISMNTVNQDVDIG